MGPWCKINVQEGPAMGPGDASEMSKSARVQRDQQWAHGAKTDEQQGAMNQTTMAYLAGMGQGCQSCNINGQNMCIQTTYPGKL